MGYWKHLHQEHIDRGFGEIPDKTVCTNCFKDKGLQKYIKTHGANGFCYYCNKKKARIISLEEIISHIQKSLRTEYPTPDNACIPFESREGGWLIEPIDIYDMLQETESINYTHEKLFKEIVGLLLENQYSPYSPGDDTNAMYESWDTFTNHVMHKSRFLFCPIKDKWSKSKWKSPLYMLKEISNTIKNNKMVSTIKKGEPIFRVRLSDDINTAHTAKSLGTVPKERAKYENRMSPAGIPMFYGGKNLATAIVEVLDKDNSFYHVATYHASRDILLIDLTQEPFLPSIYDEILCGKRASIKFMGGFIENVSKKIIKEEKQELEYISTQLVTEYLRYHFKVNKQRPDGIMYKSSKENADICYALFIENDQCISMDQSQEDDKLYLVCQSISSGKIEGVRYRVGK